MTVGTFGLHLSASNLRRRAEHGAVAFPPDSMERSSA
jgi:hypothetical protein